MKKRILIVDDDSQICESLCKLFRSEGYEVDLAAEAHGTLKKFIAQRPDLVLLDLNLPGSGGWDIFGALTLLDSFVPIIVITARQNQAQFAFEAGVGALMEKPLDVALLLKTIAELIAEGPEANLRRLAGLKCGEKLSKATVS
jgi:two-component system, OmpR family, response regulator